MLQCPFESEGFSRVAYLWLQAMGRSAMCAFVPRAHFKTSYLAKAVASIPDTLRDYHGCSNL